MPWYQTLQIVVVTAVAIITLPATIHTSYSARLRYADKVKRLLELTDKLKPDAIGRKQIESALNDATVDLAYYIQFPRTVRDQVPIALAAAILSSNAFTFFWTHRHGASLFTWSLVAMGYVLAYFLHISSRNFTNNDRITRLLFLYLHAPEGLIRPRSSLVYLQTRIDLGDVLRAAADIRDRSIERKISTVEAVNEGIPAARSKIRALQSRIMRNRIKILGLVAQYYIFRFRRPIRRIIVEFMIIRGRWKINRIERAEPARGREMSLIFERNAAEARRASKIKVESPMSVRRRHRAKGRNL